MTIPSGDRSQPLIPLLNMQHLDDLPPCVLRFHFRLAKYEYIALHESLYAAEAFSQSPTREVKRSSRRKMRLMSTTSLYLPYLPQHKDWKCASRSDGCSQWEADNLSGGLGSQVKFSSSWKTVISLQRKKTVSLPTLLQDYLWQVVATDLFELNKNVIYSW